MGRSCSGLDTESRAHRKPRNQKAIEKDAVVRDLVLQGAENLGGVRGLVLQGAVVRGEKRVCPASGIFLKESIIENNREDGIGFFSDLFLVSGLGEITR